MKKKHDLTKWQKGGLLGVTNNRLLIGAHHQYPAYWRKRRPEMEKWFVNGLPGNGYYRLYWRVVKGDPRKLRKPRIWVQFSSYNLSQLIAFCKNPYVKYPLKKETLDICRSAAIYLASATEGSISTFSALTELARGRWLPLELKLKAASK